VREQRQIKDKRWATLRQVLVRRMALDNTLES
jgi:hypothetical protein